MLCLHFHLIPGIVFISFYISSMSHSSFNSALFDLDEFVYIIQHFFSEILSFILLWSGRINAVISVFLNW